MKRLIRIDDFPHGCRDLVKTKPRDVWYAILAKALAIFEKADQPYILGCSPYLMDGWDIDWLNNHVKKGWVVMHGFNHNWSFPGPWNTVRETWEQGGEFKDIPKHLLPTLYHGGDIILSACFRYDPSHFIPPFNAYTQDLLDMLQDTPVRKLHACDCLPLPPMNFGKIELVVSEWQKTYANVNVVLRHLDNPSQITLHWIYDQMKDGWEKRYEQLCLALAKEEKR